MERMRALNRMDIHAYHHLDAQRQLMVRPLAAIAQLWEAVRVKSGIQDYGAYLSHQSRPQKITVLGILCA